MLYSELPRHEHILILQAKKNSTFSEILKKNVFFRKTDMDNE